MESPIGLENTDKSRIEVIDLEEEARESDYNEYQLSMKKVKKELFGAILLSSSKLEKTSPSSSPKRRPLGFGR